MLGKLIKHEFKATARVFLPLFLAALIMTPITRFITSLNIFDGYLELIPGLFTTMYVLILLAIAVVSGVIIIVRFYRNMVTEEGYLMHTLPVKPSQHIWSKTIVACVWTIASLSVILLSLFALFVTPDRLDLLGESIQTAITLGKSELGSHFTLAVIELSILCVLGVLSNIFYIYASISIGQVISRHRIIGAFAAAIVLYIIVQIITTVVMIPLLLATGLNVNSPDIIVSAYFPLSLVISAIMTVAYFIITNYVMTKKLNLE